MDFSMRVPPFRHPRITVRLQLPEAFRSLLRLSSASGAKAFPTCPLYLNLINPLLRSFPTFFLFSAAFFLLHGLFECLGTSLLPPASLRILGYGVLPSVSVRTACLVMVLNGGDDRT